MARPMPRLNRNITIVGSVLLLHVLVLWAMQTGLLRRVAQAIVPAEILVEIMAAPTTVAAPAPAPQPKVQAKAPTSPTAQPSPAPAATLQPTPAPLAPPAVAPSATAAPVTSAAPTAVAAAPAATSTGTSVSALPASARVELPSSSADYLNNPKPPYPALSKRLGEQGSVVIRVLISVDGTASQASIKRSSGFDRLDQAALATALQWRYVPGKRAGVPEAMWFDIPFNWMLN